MWKQYEDFLCGKGPCFDQTVWILSLGAVLCRHSREEICKKEFSSRLRNPNKKRSIHKNRILCPVKLSALEHKSNIISGRSLLQLSEFSVLKPPPLLLLPRRLFSSWGVCRRACIFHHPAFPFTLIPPTCSCRSFLVPAAAQSAALGALRGKQKYLLSAYLLARLLSWHLGRRFQSGRLHGAERVTRPQLSAPEKGLFDYSGGYSSVFLSVCDLVVC